MDKIINYCFYFAHTFFFKILLFFKILNKIATNFFYITLIIIRYGWVLSEKEPNEREKERERIHSNLDDWKSSRSSAWLVGSDEWFGIYSVIWLKRKGFYHSINFIFSRRLWQQYHARIIFFFFWSNHSNDDDHFDISLTKQYLYLYMSRFRWHFS